MLPKSFPSHFHPVEGIVPYISLYPYVLLKRYEVVRDLKEKTASDREIGVERGMVRRKEN